MTSALCPDNDCVGSLGLVYKPLMGLSIGGLCYPADGMGAPDGCEVQQGGSSYELVEDDTVLPKSLEMDANFDGWFFPTCLGAVCVG